MDLIEMISTLTGPVAGAAVLAIVYRLAKFETETRVQSEAIRALAQKVDDHHTIGTDVIKRVTYLEARLLNGDAPRRRNQ